MAALGIIIFALAVGSSTYYWVTRGRNQDYLVGRVMTAFAFGFWPIFLAYFVVAAVVRDKGATNR